MGIGRLIRRAATARGGGFGFVTMCPGRVGVDSILHMKALKYLYLVPYWLLSVFSTAKFYRENPIIGSPLLNRLGLHVFRVVLSHGLYRFRLVLLSPLVSAEDRACFLRHGYIIRQNFLPQEQFLALRQEVEEYRGPIREIKEGDTATQRLFLTRQVRRSLPECEKLVNYSPLDRMLRYAGSKNRPPFFYVENTRQHAREPGQRDPQKDCHMDTFHPCVKAWLYLDEVNERNGPFVYVPSSHRLSWKRLQWEYRQSLAASADKQRSGQRYWDGSCRVTGQDLALMGYQEPVPMCVPPNTLVIANVYGFHCRGDATGPGTRLTVWMQARDNPFNPFFTPFPRATAHIFEQVWERLLHKQDALLAKLGIRRTFEGGFDR